MSTSKAILIIFIVFGLTFMLLGHFGVTNDTTNNWLFGGLIIITAIGFAVEHYHRKIK